MEHLRAAARSLEEDLDRLGTIASARRRGEELIALLVGAHAAYLERVVALAPDPVLLEGDEQIAELLWVHRPLPPERELLDGFAERLDGARQAIGQTGVPGLADVVSHLVSTLNDIYGAALARAVELLHLDGQDGAIRAALDDELVAAALVVHGLHPDDIAVRARRALAQVAGTFSASGPQVRWRGLDDHGTIRLRAEGEPRRDRWRVAVAAERAVARAAPDAARVVVEGAQRDGSERDEPDSPEAVIIPLTSIGRRATSAPRRWVEVPELASVGADELLRLDAEGVRLLACRVGSDLYVAADPFNGDRLHLRLPPDRPPMVQSSGGSTFVFDDPLPVHRDGERIEVAIP